MDSMTNLLDEAKKYCSDFNEAKTNSEGDVLPEEYIFNAVGLIEFVSAARKDEREVIGFVRHAIAKAEGQDDSSTSVRLSEAESIAIARTHWTNGRKLEAVKTVYSLGYSLKDAKAYCELHFA